MFAYFFSGPESSRTRLEKIIRLLRSELETKSYTLKTISGNFKLASNVENANIFDENVLKFCDRRGAKGCKSYRYRQELSNEYLVAKIGVDTAENEPLKVH